MIDGDGGLRKQLLDQFLTPIAGYRQAQPLAN